MKFIFKYILPVVLLGLIAFSLYQKTALKKSEKMALPAFGQIPKFSLTNQNNQLKKSSDYQGKALVVNFIFTSCPDSCPLLTGQMLKLQNKIKESQKEGHLKDIQLVSISVDPETDSPKVLKAFTSKFAIDEAMWDFLTGSADEVQKIVVDGFKVAMGEKELNIMDVSHGEQFVIVDRLGTIRSYKTAHNTDEIAEIIRVLESLAPTS